MYKHKTTPTKNTSSRFEDENTNFANRFDDDYEQETAEQDDKTPKGQAVTKGAMQAASNAAAQDTPKTYNISRGVLQLVSEGGFKEGDNNVRKPHYPQNAAIFAKLTEDEKNGAPEKLYKGQKYNVDDIGLFKKSKTGGYKKIRGIDRHNPNEYKKENLKANEQVGVLPSDAGSQSGMTIGMGIDVGRKFNDKSKAEKFFLSAKLKKEDAQSLAEGAGIIGVKAAELAAKLRSSINLTYDEVINLLDKAVPGYDKPYGGYDYVKGDGKFHPAIEEALMNIRYWGNASLWKKLYNGTKGKKDLEQLKAAQTTTKNWSNNKYYHFFSIVVEIMESGNNVVISDKVETLDTLKGGTDDTFEIVQDIYERKVGYKDTKDLKNQIMGGANKLDTIISDSVGEGGKNIEADVKDIQMLLYNGNLDVDINGKYDEKTKKALLLFLSNHKFKSKIIKPNSKELRTLKKYKYISRTAK